MSFKVLYLGSLTDEDGNLPPEVEDELMRKVIKNTLNLKGIDEDYPGYEAIFAKALAEAKSSKSPKKDDGTA